MKRWARKQSLLQLQEQVYPFSSEELDLLMDRLLQELEYDTNLYIKEWEREYTRSKRTSKWALR
jgi:hypothetical protein